MEPTSPSAWITGDELQPLLRLIRHTTRHWRVGLVAAAAVVVATLAVDWLRPKRFRSEAVVYYREGMQWTTTEGMGARRVGQRLKDTLLSRVQLTKLVEELGLYPKLVQAGQIADAVEEARLGIEFTVREGDVFVVSFTADTPAQAQKVASRLTELLIGENARFRAQQAADAIAFLESEKKRNEADLNAKEAAQLAFLGKHPEFAQELAGALGTSRRREPAAAPYAPRDDESLAALQREEERLRRQLTSSGQTTRAPQDPLLVSAREEAEAKLKAAQRELADRRTRFTEEHPDVRTAAKAVEVAAAAYRRTAEALDAAEPALLKERLAQVQQDITAHRRRYPRERAPFVPAMTSESAKRIVALEAEWARLSREIAEARERFQQIDTRQFMASMTSNTLLSGQGSQILVIDPAYLPAHRAGMSTMRLLLAGLLLAFAGAIGAALVAALMDDRIYDEFDLERLKLAPVLTEVAQGSMAESAAREGSTSRYAQVSDDGSPGSEFVQVQQPVPIPEMDPSLPMLGPPDSPGAASFRILRHRLVERPATNAVLVTSSQEGEGKTWCALNLAVALGEGGRAKVLLLETNFRFPSLASRIGFDPPSCFAQQLALHRENPNQPWIVVATSVPWLHVAAVAPESKARPIVDAALKLFLQEFRRAGYSHIVLDSPAILGSADVNLLEESVDGVLLTVKAGQSRARALRKAIAQVGGKKLLGFALLGA